MKLYEVPNKTYVKIEDQTVFFDHIDGSFSLCKNDKGEVVHLGASTEVEIVEP